MMNKLYSMIQESQRAYLDAKRAQDFGDAEDQRTCRQKGE
jgi:hypothetical protein